MSGALNSGRPDRRRAAVGSLALLADTIHVLADVSGVFLALGCNHPRCSADEAAPDLRALSPRILVTVANGLLLLGLSIFILVEAYGRWFNP